jgi:hypothetical protein
VLPGLIDTHVHLVGDGGVMALERAAGAHEFQTRQPAQTVSVPFPEGRVLCLLTDDRVLHDRIAELVNDCRDREYATKSSYRLESAICWKPHSCVSTGTVHHPRGPPQCTPRPTNVRLRRT